MFGKKEKIPQAQTPQIPQEMTEKIRTMPNPYYSEERKKGHGFLFLLIMIIVFFIVAGGGVFWVMLQKRAATETDVNNANINADAPGIVPSPSSQPSPEATQTPTPLPEATPTPIAPTPENLPASPLDSSDIDNDNLTGEEEKIFATNSNSSDTDSDGYSDSNELLAGYDPRLREKTLAESEIVQQMSLAGDAKVLYPAEWLARQSGQGYIFDSKKGDIMSVFFLSNSEKSSPEEWFSKNDSSIVFGELLDGKLISKNIAYRTPDNLKYYIFSGDFSRVYVFSYTPSSPNLLLYLSTFQMMANSLRF